MTKDKFDAPDSKNYIILHTKVHHYIIVFFAVYTYRIAANTAHLNYTIYVVMCSACVTDDRNIKTLFPFKKWLDTGTSSETLAVSSKQYPIRHKTHWSCQDFQISRNHPTEKELFCFPYLFDNTIKAYTISKDQQGFKVKKRHSSIK